MAENDAPEMQATLGLTGLTMNAMALIAPGAFLWLTFYAQATEGATAPAMWPGILLALLRGLATAVCYAELAKWYPGTGSSYYFAEQSFLNHEKAWKYARLSMFIVGWGSHLYYWIYPGVMVGVTGIFVGYVAGTLWPNSMSASNPGPVFMGLVAVVFSLGVAYIAHRGVNGSTGVNIAINVIQISALIVFSVMALGYRMNHPPGSVAFQFDSPSGEAYTYEFATTSQVVNGTATDVVVRDANMVPQPKLDASGKPVPYHVDYPYYDSTGTFESHPNSKSVIAPHKWGWVFVQATVAILILVGFESCTALGGEARNAKRDIPIAVILSLLIQGAFCYLFEYFASCYFLNSGYTMANAAGSGAPLGDMMVMVGTWLFGSYSAGRAFMLVQAFTVFLALIGTTLSCLSTGARVTYAMGKDEEVPGHFGMLHGKRLTPYRAIWTLAGISAVIGISTVVVYLGGTTPSPLEDKYHNVWYAFGIFESSNYTRLPNTLVIVTLISNFGTFLLYMLTCLIAIVAFRDHQLYNGFKHMVVPLFGLVANLLCMLFYLVGPFTVSGMSIKEPYIALGICAVWGIYGGLYFLRASKAKGKPVYVDKPAMALSP